MATAQDVPQGEPYRAMPELAALYARWHSEDQERIADKTAAGLLLAWNMLRPEDLDRYTTSWMHVALGQVEKGWNESAALATDFVQAAKWSVELDSPAMPILGAAKPVGVSGAPAALSDHSVLSLPSFPSDQVATSLRVTGPVEVKRQVGQGVPVSEAMQAGAHGSAGAGGTQAVKGGHAQVIDLVARDAPKRLAQGKAIGYARVTDDSPCYFCALLASRGAVYASDSFDESNSRVREIKWPNAKDRGSKRAFLGDGVAKVHDHCKCSLRPVYSKADKYDDRAKFFYSQWKNSAGMNDYRKHYVPPSPYSAGIIDLAKRRELLKDIEYNRGALVKNGVKQSDPRVSFLDKSKKKLTSSSMSVAEQQARYHRTLETGLAHLRSKGLPDDSPQVARVLGELSTLRAKMAS